MPVKNLKFTIDIQNTDDGAKKLLHEIKPTWKWDNVEQKMLSGGFSCVMIRFTNKSNSDDSVTVRIRNLLSNLTDKQKKFELEMLPILSETGLFTDLLATFENGYCYQYIKGQPVLNAKSGEFILTDSIMKKVAEKIVQVHTIKLPGADYTNSNFFEPFLNMLNLHYNPPSARFPTREEFIEECKYLKTFLDKMNTPIGFCYGDFQLSNMVWNKETEAITFVDWELVHIGYLYSDLSHLVSLASTLWSRFLRDFAPNINQEEIPKDLRIKFCKSYYEEWIKYHKKPFAQKELDSLTSDVGIFQLCDVFMILVFGVCLDTTNAKEMPPQMTQFQEANLDIYRAVKKKHCGSDKFGFPK